MGRVRRGRSKKQDKKGNSRGQERGQVEIEDMRGTVGVT